MAAALATSRRNFLVRDFVWSGGAEEVICFTVCMPLPSSLPFTAGKLLSCVYHLSADIDVIILKVILESPSSWNHTSKQLSLLSTLKSELKTQTGWNRNSLRFPNNMKARTSQEDANCLVVWLLLLCWVMKFQNLFLFLLLCFAQPCEHSAVHSCNTATVVKACKDIRLLVQPMLGENAIQASRMSTHSFIYCFYYFEVPESCSVRESPWRRVCSPHQRVNVSPGKKADQPSPLDHQQRWRWRGLQPALSLWLLTSVWWGVIRARGSQQQLCTTGRECVSLHVGQFFTDGPIYYHHTPAVYHRSGLLFGR